MDNDLSEFLQVHAPLPPGKQIGRRFDSLQNRNKYYSMLKKRNELFRQIETTTKPRGKPDIPDEFGESDLGEF